MEIRQIEEDSRYNNPESYNYMGKTITFEEFEQIMKEKQADKEGD